MIQQVDKSHRVRQSYVYPTGSIRIRSTIVTIYILYPTARMHRQPFRPSRTNSAEINKQQDRNHDQKQQLRACERASVGSGGRAARLISPAPRSPNPSALRRELSEGALSTRRHLFPRSSPAKGVLQRKTPLRGIRAARRPA